MENSNQPPRASQGQPPGQGQSPDEPVPANEPATGGAPSLAKSELSHFFADYWEATRSVVLSPVQFFKHMPTEGGMGAPSKFLAVSVGGYFITQFIWCHDVFASFFDAAFCALFLLLMAKGILYILKQFGGKGTFEGTFRVLAYSSPPLVLMGFQWIAPFALLYMSALWFLGLKEVHDIKVG